MEHKLLPNFWMVLPNLLSMNVLANSHLALKQKNLYFTASTSAHFGHKFVMNGCIWEVSPSSHVGCKLCLSLPKGQNVTLSPHLKSQAGLCTGSDYGGNSFPWEGIAAKVVVIAIGGVWGTRVEWPPGSTGTVLQHGVTLARASERWWASDKHQSNLESFAVLWCYQPICRNHLIYGKCHI